MRQKIFLDSIYQSMQDSAREVRLSLGRPSSHATRQQALQQVAMLKAAKDAQKLGKYEYVGKDNFLFTNPSGEHHSWP